VCWGTENLQVLTPSLVVTETAQRCSLGRSDPRHEDEHDICPPSRSTVEEPVTIQQMKLRLTFHACKDPI